MVTLEELEERIKKLEKKVLIQDEVIKRTLGFVQRAIDEQYEKRSANYKQWKEDQERFRKESEKRAKEIKARMKKLGYKID